MPTITVPNRKPKKRPIAVAAGRGSATTTSPHGYLAQSNLAAYTPNVATNNGTDFFHYNIDQPTTINTISGKALGDRGTIILKYTTAGHAITWDPEYWFPSGPLALETDVDAWNIIDYKVIQSDKICMEFVASCPGVTTIPWFLATFETNAAAEIGWDDVNALGTGFEWTNDAGTTWNTHAAADPDPWVVPAAGIYTMRKTDGPLNTKFGDGSSIEGAKFINTITVEGKESTITRSMFTSSGCNVIDVSGFYTSEVTDMYGMFGTCRNITALDLSNWDTTKVTSMWNMFINCDNITSVNASILMNTSNVEDFDGCFQNCDALTAINGTVLRTDSAKSMQNMFSGCLALTTVDVSAWDVTNVTDISKMFNGCTSLTSLTTGGWGIGGITEFDGMFAGTTSLTTLDLNSWDMTAATNLNQMFSGSGLTSLAVDAWRLPNLQGVTQLFNSTQLTTVDVSQWGCTNITQATNVFQDSKFTSLDLSTWGFANVTNFYGMFKNATDLVCLTNIDTASSTSWPSKTAMFENTPALVQPDAAAQTDLTDSDGANWVNANPC